MQRIAIAPRPEWQRQVEAAGLTWHTDAAGATWWNESAVYAFTRDEIDTLTRTAEELHRHLSALAGEVAERPDPRLGLSATMQQLVRESWRRGDPPLVGRFDFAYTGGGSAPRLLEYNADNAGLLVESTGVQAGWFADLTGRLAASDAGLGELLRVRGSSGLLSEWNIIEHLLAGRMSEVARVMTGPGLHLTAPDTAEDAGGLDVIARAASAAGVPTCAVPIDRIGWNPDAGHFVDDLGQEIRTVVGAYPWAWMMQEPFVDNFSGASGGQFRWIEPAWRALAGSKGLLPLLAERHREHPAVLDARFDGDAASDPTFDTYVRKPIWAGRGEDITVQLCGDVLAATPAGSNAGAAAPGAETHVRQALATLPVFDGYRAVVSVWMVGGTAAGVIVREDRSLITGGDSRLAPHVVID